jgi:fermentation-respiration switch protein FrsA (DUF1100 family)
MSCDYPWGDPAKLSWSALVLKLPRVRAELLATARALELAVDYLVSRREVDTARLFALGASLGVPPLAAWAAGDPRPRAVALLYGGADLGAILEANMGRRLRSAAIRRFAARTFGLALRPLEPSRTVGRIAPRPLLVVASADDQWIPTRSARLLYEAAREPKRLVWLGGEHVRTGDVELLRALTDSVVAWAADVLPTRAR